MSPSPSPVKNLVSSLQSQKTLNNLGRCDSLHRPKLLRCVSNSVHTTNTAAADDDDHLWQWHNSGMC
jgi:hypothetical protein